MFTTHHGHWIIQRGREEEALRVCMFCNCALFPTIMMVLLMVPCSLFFFDFFRFIIFSTFPTHQDLKIERRESKKHIFENDVDADSCIHIDKGCGVDNAGCALDDYDMDETSAKT